jgi:dihydropteroate synthase-like protein
MPMASTPVIPLDTTTLRGKRLLFVTGRLAESRLREVVSEIAAKLGFEFEITVPGIQVAALLHTGLLRSRLQVASDADCIIIPGWCQGELGPLEQQFGRPIYRGPRDLNDLPQYFGVGKRREADLSTYSTEIIAEINHATRMALNDVVTEAGQLAAAGANVIDIGGVPGESSPRIAEIVQAVRGEGLRVSIDSFDRPEVEQAVSNGAELILSCNQSNVDWVTKFGVEVVAIPSTPQDMASLDRLIERLQADQVPFRADPILEPIGMGFTESLERYMNLRRRHPDVAIMMGIGNVTELTEVDSAGVNMLLAAICEELGVQSVLTTQVINWCRSAVAEFDKARRLVRHAVAARTIPKHIDSSLVMLRDARLHRMPAQSIADMAKALTDRNYRIFAEAGELHLLNRDGYWHGDDVFRLFESASTFASSQQSPIDAGHAFYLGYEMARAEIALHLGKQYVQDAPMSFGLLGDVKASSSARDDHRP